MKPEQLEAIRKRSAKTSGNWLADYLKLQSAQIVLTDDVPALIDEVDRLQAIIDELIETIYEHANAGSALMDLAAENARLQTELSELNDEIRVQAERDDMG